MPDGRTIDELKQQGAGQLAPEPVASLYRAAFAAFGTQSLWSRTPSAQPTIGQALTIAQALRTEGDMRTRALAARIEAACRAAL